MSFHFVLKRSETLRHGDPLYYLLAANGVFQVRDGAAYTAVTRVRGRLPGLLSQRESLRLRVPRLPACVLEETLAFFRAVWDAHRSEAIVQLFYRSEDRRYRVEPPPQRVSGPRGEALRLWYGALRCPPGFVRFGTLHSHGNQPAAASALDREDEVEQDGLHVVFGHLDAVVPSCSACFVSNGVRFELDPEHLLEPCRVPEPRASPAWWSRVQVAER